MRGNGRRKNGVDPRGPGRGRGRRRGRRRIGSAPSGVSYKPQGVPMDELDTVDLRLEELEAMRLCDKLGLIQQEAATRMGISRRTLWTDLKSGRRKVVTAILEGKGIDLVGLESSRFLTEKSDDKEK